jgi:hypothetical protein
MGVSMSSELAVAQMGVARWHHATTGRTETFELAASSGGASGGNVVQTGQVRDCENGTEALSARPDAGFSSLSEVFHTR